MKWGLACTHRVHWSVCEGVEGPVKGSHDNDEVAVTDDRELSS
jgi:hypothetical protein